MQLVEQGKLALDTDIAELLPDLAKAKVLEGFATDGTPILRAPRRAITLRHLLTHTSGFAYDMWNADIGRYIAATDTPGIISCQNAALTLPLTTDPGTRWEYGIGIDWAGKAVEAVSGQTLDAYMQANIFAPLGMTDTGFKIGPRAHAGRPGLDRHRDPAGPRVPHGRRRSLRHGRRLPEIRPDDPAQGHLQRGASPAAGDRGADVRQCHGRSGLQCDEDGLAALHQ
jgi:CubicO group peptidase (beta-lactamase class C family)